MRHIFVFLSVILLGWFAAAPVAAEAKCGGNGGKIAGGLLGAAGGALLGRTIDGGRNKTAGTLIGGILGGLAGSQIGKALDKCEQEKVATATQAALDTEGNVAPQKWSSDSREGVGGTVKAAPVQRLADGRVCRSVTRVNYIDGQEMQDKPTFCRLPPSKSWAAA